ncbi:FMN-binding protein [Fusobacterium sp. PH5-44]|uniref:FMN-binding protein n=1 Tax=unclassified Fusobacterium TaxID=2648384 RepID=UPI003D2582E1
MKKLSIVYLLLFLFISSYGATKEGIGSGYNGEIKVSVEVDGNKILSIKVTKDSEDNRIGKPALNNLIAEIIKKQTPNVDTIAGATYTSKGLIEAVSNALK